MYLMEKIDVQRVYQSLKPDFPKFDFELKSKQVECLSNLIQGHHVLALLPTGYGKSMLYTLFPLLVEQVRSYIDQSSTISTAF